MSHLEATIRTVTRVITNAIENDGDPIATAKELGEQVRTAWKQGLEDTGMPPEHIARLQFPI